MKIIKKQYGGAVYSSQGIQNIGNKVFEFIENGGVKGWLDRKKDKKFLEELKKRNPSKEEILHINPETGLRVEQPLVSEDFAISSAIIPALGGGINFSKKIKFNIDDANSYYRMLIDGKGAEEAIETGVIRGNPQSKFNMPYFIKGKPPFPHNGDTVIKITPDEFGKFSTNKNIQVIGLDPHEIAEEVDIQKAIDKVNDRAQFTFLTDGKFNQVPTEMSTIWNRKSFLGIPYYKRIYKQGGTLKAQLGTKLPSLSQFNSSKLGKTLDWIDLGADVTEIVRNKQGGKLPLYLKYFNYENS